MTQLVRIRAAGADALVSEISRTLAFLDRVPEVRFEDVAYTCSLAEGDSSLVVIARDVQDLRARLSSALSRISAGAERLRDKSGTY